MSALGLWTKRAGRQLVQMFSGTGLGQKLLERIYRSRIGDPPKRGTLEFLQTYEASPWVRAVVGKIAKAIGETEWKLEGPRGELRDHLMLQVLRQPNPCMTGPQLLEVAQQQLETVGDAFLLKERNGLGAPVGLYPFPPHAIREVPTPTRPFFRISWMGAQEDIPSSEFLWLREIAPADPYGRGAGVAMALGDEIGADEHASKHIHGLFYNRAMPDFVVMDPGAGDQEIARHEQHWLQRLQGFWRSFKPYFVNRKLEFWQPQAMNLENLTLVPLRKHERDIILQTWGFPPEQLGIVESSNRATADASDYIFEKRIVRPRRNSLRGALQAFLAPDYDSRLVVKYRDTVPAWVEFLLNVGKAAPYSRRFDEWRELQGLPAVGGELGASYYVPLQGYLSRDPLDLTQRPQAGLGGRPAGDEKPEDERA